MIKTALFAAAAALATVATASPVLAKDVLVRYGDLDLASTKGQQAFARRIDRAAKVACDFHAENRIPSNEALRCYRQARAKAKTEMALAVENERLGG
jgi:UrcA family protein